MKSKIWIIITAILGAIVVALSSVLIVNGIMVKKSYNPYEKNRNKIQDGIYKLMAITTPTDALDYVYAEPDGVMAFGKWTYVMRTYSGNNEFGAEKRITMRNDKVLEDNIRSTFINASFRDDIAPEITYISPELSYTAVFYLNTPYTSSLATVVQEVIDEYSFDGVKVKWVGMQTSDREDDIIMGVPVNDLNGNSIEYVLNDLNSDTETLKVIEAMGFLGEAKLDIKNRIDYLDKRENHTALAIGVTATFDGIMALRQIRELGKDLTQMKIYPN